MASPSLFRFWVKAMRKYPSPDAPKPAPVEEAKAEEVVVEETAAEEPAQAEADSETTETPEA